MRRPLCFLAIAIVLVASPSVVSAQVPAPCFRTNELSVSSVLFVSMNVTRGIGAVAVVPDSNNSSMVAKNASIIEAKATNNASPAYRIYLACPDAAVQWQPALQQSPEPLLLTGVQERWSGAGELVVSWSTNHETMGRVWWALSGDAASGLIEDGTFSTQHVAVVRGLEPGKHYTVRVAAIDRESAYVVSEPISADRPHGPASEVDWGTPVAAGLVAGAAVAALRIRTVHRR